MSTIVAATVPGERVGIWHRTGAGDWHRDPARRAEWSRWANVDCLPAKRPGVRRILWVGESLARGFFFDPEYTPARALAATLEQQLPGPVEVLDLGSNGLTASRLSGLIDELRLLEPDAIVLTAGNNWHGPDDLNPASAREALSAFRAGGRGELRRWCCESHLPGIATRLMGQLHRVARTIGNIPVVVVVPGFNLRDWQAPPSQLFPWLTGETAGQWHQLRTTAEVARAQGDATALDAVAQRLRAIDRSDAPYTHYLVADLAFRRERTEDALEALEGARDATCSPFLPFLPRCPKPLQTALCREAARHGFTVVNLAELLSARSPAGIPGRRLFLDYCHLSAEGNQLLVDHVARQLGAPASTAEPPPRHVQARAHFLAAVHNSRYAQRRDVLRYHLQAALELAPDTADLLSWYATEATAAAPLWLTRAAPTFFQSAQLRRHLMAPSPNHAPPFPDAILGEVITALLPGTPNHPGEMLGTVDLLAARSCHRAADEASPEEFGATRAYFRARTPESSFFLPLAGPRGIELELTSRIGGAAAATLNLTINGAPGASVRAERTWRNHRISVPAGNLRAGLNVIAVHWPTTGYADLSAEEAEAQWDRGAVPDLRPWFGDLFTLRAVLG